MPDGDGSCGYGRPGSREGEDRISLRVIALLVISFIVYKIVVLLGGDATAHDILSKPLFSMPMVSGARWVFTIGDLIILLTMVLLFAELIKSTYTFFKCR